MSLFKPLQPLQPLQPSKCILLCTNMSIDQGCGALRETYEPLPRSLNLCFETKVWHYTIKAHNSEKQEVSYLKKHVCEVGKTQECPLLSR